MSKYVKVGLILNQEEAERKAEIFIHSRPGLMWNGKWTTSQSDTTSAIGMTVGGTCDVSVGPIWNKIHAEERAAKFIARNPHLKWNGKWKTTVFNRMSDIEVLPLPNLELNMPFVYPRIEFNLNNELDEKIRIIDVSELDNNDWDEYNRPDKKFQGRCIEKNTRLSDCVSVNYWSYAAPLKMKFILESGGAIEFHVDARIAIDNKKEVYNETQWSVQVDGDRDDVSLFYTTTPYGWQTGVLNVFICKTQVVEDGLQDKSPPVFPPAPSSRVRMSIDSPEVNFWRTLIRLFLKAESPLLQPNPMVTFENLIATQGFVDDWTLIFNIPHSSFTEMLQFGIHQLLANLNLKQQPIQLVELLYYAMQTVKFRIGEVLPGQRHMGRLQAARVWGQFLLAAWHGYNDILFADTSAVVTVVVAAGVVAKLSIGEIIANILEILSMLPK